MKKLLLLLLLNVAFVLQTINAQCPPAQFPPDPPGDNCILALGLCQDINGYCETLDNNNVTDDFPGCPGNVLNNDEWFSFVACAPTLSIQITPSNCQGLNGQFGMQAAMYEGSCTGTAVATECNCTTGPMTLTATTTPGQSYYIVLDGCAGDICDYDIQVLAGNTEPCPPPDAIPMGPTEVCPGLITNYTISIGSADNYEWSITNPNVASFAGPPIGSDVNVQFIAEGTVDICTQGENVCGQSSNIACLTVNVVQPPDVMDAVSGCLFDLVECPQAPGSVFQITQPFETVIIPQVDALGCMYNVVCELTAIIIPPVDLGQVELCGPATYEMCPGNIKFITGLYIEDCEDPASGCLGTVSLDLAIFEPIANIATPIPELDCDPASTIMLDGTGSTLFNTAIGGTTILEWTGPGIVGSSSDPIVTVNEPGEYCLSVTFERNGFECTDTECVTVEENANTPGAPTLMGETDPCEGTLYLYDADASGTPLPDGYEWTTPNGEPFTVVDINTIEIDWTGSAGGQLCVEGTSACGNSPSTCITITVGEAPDVPVVDGPEDVCAVNQSETYTITNIQANVTYTWTVPNGASFIGSGSSIDVNFDGADLGAGQVCATAMNDCGTSDPGCFDLNVLSLPPVPDLTGPTTVCSNGTGYTYTVSNGSVGDTYNWTAPAGATIIGTGNSVEVDFNGSQTGDVCVTITNECGTSQQTCVNVTVIQAPEATITGMGALCEGSTETVDLTITVTGTAPWDVEYTIDGMNPTTITINSSPYTLTTSETGVYELTSLSSNGGCAGTVSGTATIEENPLPEATLSGTDNICENSGDLGELEIILTGEAPWTIGWESNAVAQAPVTANASPFTLNVSEGQAGNITLSSVVDGNGCVGTVAGSGTITIIQAPTVVSVDRVCNATNDAYTVTIVIQGGDPTSYSVTPGNGNLAGNTFVSNAIFSGLGYSFTVSDVNNCNPVLVEGSFECNCETMVGTMDQAAIEECGDGPIDGLYDDTDEFLDGDDVVEFILHSGNGTTIVAPIVGQYSSPDNISFDPATMTYGVTYYLSAVVGNDNGSGGVDLTDPCLSVAIGTPVTFFEIPEAVISGMDEICEGETGTLTVTFTGEAPWELSYDDGTGVIQTVTGINTNPYDLVVTPTMAGLNTFCLTGMTDNNCPGTVSGCADVMVNTGVIVDDWSVECNATATGFVVTIQISGGDPTSYSVTGIPGTLTGNIFTSDEIPTGVGIGFSATVTDDNDCDPQIVSQTEVVCDCTSDAGEMDLNQLSDCGDGPITAPDATNIELDGDDVLIYYLHEGNAGTLVNVIATNTVPTFSFDPALMTYGTIYYISSVVGNADPTGNGVDPTDPCRSIASGTPIVFYEIPTATISGGTLICPGDEAELMVELTGDSPWSVTINGVDYDMINGSPFLLTVTPGMTTTYTLESVRDANCDNTLMEETTVTLHDPPVISMVSEDCNSTGTAYTVCFTISGGDAASYVVTPNTGTLTGDQFCSDLITSGDGYSFEVTDIQGCDPAIQSIQSFSCDCPTVAGTLDPTPINVCSNEMTPAGIVYDASMEVLDPDDVLCYALYNGTNTLATNPDEPVFGFNPGNMVLGQVYEICPVAGNDDGTGCVDFSDPCISIGGCVEVIFNALPTATLSGVVDICQGEDPNLSVDLTGTGPWVIMYENSAGDMLVDNATSSPHILTNAATAISTIFTLNSVTDANGCTNQVSGSSATVNVNAAPTFVNLTEDCNAIETEFTVSFTITGGDPTSYTVDYPGTIVGNVYTSDPIPSNSTYTILLDDGNGCGPTVIDDGHACDCLTEVGLMAPGPFIVCGDESTTTDVYNNSGEVLDPNDDRIFILLSFPVLNATNVVAVNPFEPVFDFIPGTMSYGTTYYLVAVVGNADGMGGIDPNDLCLSISDFAEVRFYDLPTVSIQAPDAICEGENAPITFNISGVAPITVNYTVNGVAAPPINVPFAGTQTIDIPLPTSSTLSLVSIDDAFCSNTVSQTITIDVNQNVNAGDELSPLEYCEGDNQTIQLFSQISGADAGGVWTSQSGQVINNGTINVGTLGLGTNIFTYTVSALPPCPDDASTVEINIIENPVADAGPDLSIDCNTTSVELNIGNTTPGASTTWTGTGIIDPSNPIQTISNPGIYTLTATIGNCTDVDEMELSLNVSTPIPVLNPNPVSCFGETDGFVIVESVDGGVAPYLFSIDGGPFVAQQSFLNLAPGSHTIEVEDDLGCTSTETFEILEPVEVTVTLGANFPPNADPILALGESVVLSAFTTPGPGSLDSIIWMPEGIDSSCMGCPQITVSPSQQTAYSATVNVGGCTAEDIFTIFISKERPVYVPNAFSPNDDLINDVLHVYGGESVAKVNSFVLFNRWGETVYQIFNIEPAPRDFTFGWDGKHRGEFMNPGVFVWTAEIEFTDGSTGTYQGDVTLIRNQ